MKKNMFWVLKSSKNRPSEEVDESFQQSSTSELPNGDWGLEYEKDRLKNDDKHKENSQQVTTEVLDFKHSLRVSKSNFLNRIPVDEKNSEVGDENSNSTQGQPQIEEITQSQAQNGETQSNSAKQLFSSIKRFGEGTDKSYGFSLNLDDEDIEIPDSVIKMLIQKFLNQSFLTTSTDLNTRQNNMNPQNGNLKWNIPDLIKHKVTKDLNKMPYDKYGFANENGKGEDIPLAFYFDLSDSMSSYSKLLSLIAIRVLQNKVSVLLGYNEIIYYQIDKVPRTFTAEDFRSIIEKEMTFAQIKANPRYKGVEIKQVDRKINDYLREKKARKLTAFTDFDPKIEIEDLSNYCEIWWFCFVKRYVNRQNYMKDFKGHFYNTTKVEDFKQHLSNITSSVYEKRQRRIMEGGMEH